MRLPVRWEHRPQSWRLIWTESGRIRCAWLPDTEPSPLEAFLREVGRRIDGRYEFWDDWELHTAVGAVMIDYLWDVDLRIGGDPVVEQFLERLDTKYLLDNRQVVRHKVKRGDPLTVGTSE